VNNAYKPLRGVLVVLAGVAAVVVASRATRPKELVPWRHDLSAATSEARQAGKPMFIYFTASWCGPCQEMRRTTWSDADVERALQAYVPVKIDVDEHPDLARRYRVEAFPTFMVQAAGEDAPPKKSTEGAMMPEEFIRWLGRGT
jgi:thiol:disulfide interchange protein